MISPDGLRAILVTPVIAIILTCIRLFDRYRNRLLGPDDAWALLSMLFIIIFVITWNLWLVAEPSLHLARVPLYYLVSEAFYAVVWSARISIIFCLVRVSPGAAEKRFLYIVVAIFMVFWAFLSAQVLWICQSQSHWKQGLFASCNFGNQVAFSQLITSISSDLLLMAWPIRLFWALRSSRGLRIRLMAIFSTCLVTSAVSLVHNIFTVKAEGLNQAIAAIVEVTVSLIVCNLPIVVGAIYRLSGDSLEAAGGGWGTPVDHIAGTPHTVSVMQFSQGLSEVAVELDVGKSLSDSAVSMDEHASLRTKAGSSMRLANFRTSRWNRREGDVDRAEVIELSMLSPVKTHDSRSVASVLPVGLPVNDRSM